MRSKFLTPITRLSFSGNSNRSIVCHSLFAQLLLYNNRSTSSTVNNQITAMISFRQCLTTSLMSCYKRVNCKNIHNKRFYRNTSVIENPCYLLDAESPEPIVQHRKFHTFLINLQDLVSATQGWLQQSNLPCLSKK